MFRHNAVAGAYCARRRVSRPTSASVIPRPPNSFGTDISRYPAVFSSSKSSWQNRLSRSYIGARSRHRSSSGCVRTEVDAVVTEPPWYVMNAGVYLSEQFMARPSDIIVIGAGIVGCAVAEELSRRGAAVEIVDERSVGMGATQASAGVLAPYLEAREDGPFLDLTVRSLDLFDDLIARVSADAGVAVPYRRTGTIDVATTDVELRALATHADLLRRRGVPALLLDADGAHAEEPLLGDGALGALQIESHGFVGAGDLTRALVAAARRHGAQLIEPSRVRRITRLNGDIVVDTDRGSLSGNAVVLAAGS